MKIEQTDLEKVKNYIELRCDLEDISVQKRTTDYAFARFTYMEAAKRLMPKKSLETIANVVNRDHATMLNGLKKFSGLPECYQDLCNETVSYFVNNKNLSKYESEQKMKDYFSNELAKKDKTILELEKRLKGIQDNGRENVINILNNLPDKKFNEIWFRLETYLKVNAPKYLK